MNPPTEIGLDDVPAIAAKGPGVPRVTLADVDDAPAGCGDPQSPASPRDAHDPDEPSLDEALIDPALFAEYIAPYGTLVDEETHAGDPAENEPFAGLSHAQVVELVFDGEPAELIEDLIPRGVLVLVAGLPETYKGWLCTKAATAVAAGEGELLGRRVLRQGAVGYFWQDDSTRNEIERVQLFARVHETPRDLPLRWFLNEGVALPDDLERLRATIELHGFVLIVLDSVYNFTPGLDLKDRDVGRLFARLKTEVCDATECTVLLVDHMPWSTEANRRRLRSYGDVFKGAAARAGIYIDAEGSKLWVEARGNSITGFKRTLAYWDADALELRLVETGGLETGEARVEERAESVLTWLVERPGRHSTSAVRKGVGGRESMTDKALEALKGRAEVFDLGRDGGPWSGRSGEARYWIASVHAASDGLGTSAQLFGPGSAEVAAGAPSTTLGPPPLGGPRSDGPRFEGESEDGPASLRAGVSETDQGGSDAPRETRASS